MYDMNDRSNHLAKLVKLAGLSGYRTSSLSGCSTSSGEMKRKVYKKGGRSCHAEGEQPKKSGRIGVRNPKSMDEGRKKHSMLEAMKVREPHKFGEIAGKAASAADTAGKKVKSTAEDVGSKIKSGAEDAGRKIKDSAEDTGKKVKAGAEDAWSKTRKFFNFNAGGSPAKKPMKANMTQWGAYGSDDYKKNIAARDAKRASQPKSDTHPSSLGLGGKRSRFSHTPPSKTELAGSRAREHHSFGDVAGTILLGPGYLLSKGAAKMAKKKAEREKAKKNAAAATPAATPAVPPKMKHGGNTKRCGLAMGGAGKVRKDQYKI